MKKSTMTNWGPIEKISQIKYTWGMPSVIVFCFWPPTPKNKKKSIWLWRNVRWWLLTDVGWCFCTKKHNHPNSLWNHKRWDDHNCYYKSYWTIVYHFGWCTFEEFCQAKYCRRGGYIKWYPDQPFIVPQPKHCLYCIPKTVIREVKQFNK